MAFRIVLTCCKGIGLLFLASAIIEGRQSPRKRHNLSEAVLERAVAVVLQQPALPGAREVKASF